MQKAMLSFDKDSIHFSIYTVHDEVKDKAFELEMSWVGEGERIELDYH